MQKITKLLTFFKPKLPVAQKNYYPETLPKESKSVVTEQKQFASVDESKL